MSVYIAVLRNPALVKKQAELEERLNQAGQDYLTGKRERITRLRGLGFKPNQIDTFLSYVPKISKNSTTRFKIN